MLKKNKKILFDIDKRTPPPLSCNLWHKVGKKLQRSIANLSLFLPISSNQVMNHYRCFKGYITLGVAKIHFAPKA